MSAKDTRHWAGTSLRAAAIGALAAGVLAAAGCRERREVVVRHEEHPVIVEHRPAEVVVIRDAPPPLIVERIPPPPSPRHIWIVGHYEWRDRYYWVPGHHEIPPHEHAMWVPDAWKKTNHGWEHAPGRWADQAPPPRR